MPEWKKLPVRELLSGFWPGEWGSDALPSEPPAVVYRSTELDDDGHVDQSEVLRHIPAEKLESKRLLPGDILLEASGGTPGRPVGRVGLYMPEKSELAICSNFLRTLRPNSSVLSAYLRWVLLHLHRSPVIWRFQQQTTGMSNLNVQGYIRQEVDVAPPHEQRRIVEVLSTIDKAIERNEALIAKTQQIKSGLMHDLFTRGVTPDGRLRPPREEAPELYKASALGWIPVEWNVERLDDIAQRGSGHTPSKRFPEYWNGGIKWISLADSWRLDRVHISDTDNEISQRGIENSSAALHPAGIVVLSRDAGIGKSAITTCEMAVSQHFMCWRCGPRLNNYFLYYWLQFRKWEFENIATGSTIPTIGLRFFKNYKICTPTRLAEQEKIGADLLTSDERIHSLEASLAKLKQTRAGLMHDLLTGRVAIPGSASASI
jgi:restriction endonuclease S subunit